MTVWFSTQLDKTLLEVNRSMNERLKENDIKQLIDCRGNEKN